MTTVVRSERRVKRVVLVQPESQGGNFEYVMIPRQGLLFLAGALKQWRGSFLYDTEIWFEERSGRIDLEHDLEGVDILMVTALINEAPRAYEIGALAKLYHPELVTIGGGPHMSPLPEEAIREGAFDVIVNREGEDVVGRLCDVLVKHKREDRTRFLKDIPGISFLENGNLYQTPRVGLIQPDFVGSPDFRAIRDLSPGTPMLGGVIETLRGCVEKCTYCQVIQQFLGYRFVKPQTELDRLLQLQELAANGLIHTNRAGEFSVFISDDLHPPPLRAVKSRDMRLDRLRQWKNSGLTQNMHVICQARAEIGQDPKLAQAMLDAGIGMLYVGVESDNAENLKAVNKRQDPGQVHKDLQTLREMGFKIVAMTIIGLPYDTEESIMELADWVTQVSHWQTANWLTPLPATSNWTELEPLRGDGEVLQVGEMRPYSLYTGRQLVHRDNRWTMGASRELLARYESRLRPIDSLYGKVFRASIGMNAPRWASYIAALFHESSPDLAGKIEQVLRKPSGDALEELAVHVHTFLGGARSNARVQEGLMLLRSFTKLFAYTKVAQQQV